MRNVFLVLFLTAVSVSAGAITPTQHIMQQLSALSSEFIYNYSVEMYSADGKNEVDRLEGILSHKGTGYLDSNTGGVVAVNDKYYYKVDYRQKSVSVYNISLLEKKLGMRLEKIAAGVPRLTDSIPLSQINLKVDSTDRFLFRLTWQVEGQKYAYFTLYIKKSNYQLDRFVIDRTEYERGRPVAVYKYSIYNIRLQVPAELIDPAKRFKLEGDKVIPNAKYKGYTLNAIVS